MQTRVVGGPGYGLQLWFRPGSSAAMRAALRNGVVPNVGGSDFKTTAAWRDQKHPQASSWGTCPHLGRSLFRFDVRYSEIARRLNSLLQYIEAFAVKQGYDCTDRG